MAENPDDLCPRPDRLPPLTTQPHAAPIYLSSVYECRDPAQAEMLLAGAAPGYVYARDGHPNADLLAEKCRQLHAAERAAITSSGMAALSLAVLSQLVPGDHVIASNQLYGRSLKLLAIELPRLGIAATVVDTCDLAAVERAATANTKLIVVETISNPMTRVADLRALAELAHRRGAALLADNTLAGPIICRPLEWGADFVLESVTKSLNGHSDVVLGLLCGPASRWQRVNDVNACWGLASAPFDCWLAVRGLATLSVRTERACANAIAIARLLAAHSAVESVHFPGLPEHPDHQLASRQFGDRFGSMLAITLKGGGPAAEKFIAAARQIAFCPSLGELNTTLSHPTSTSHRTITPEARRAIGITEGTIRLSIGIESSAGIAAALGEGLAALD